MAILFMLDTQKPSESVTPMTTRLNRRRFIQAALAASVIPEQARAFGCGPQAVGTARTMTVSTAGGPRFGQKQYPDTLPLADGEVVLTFDDGPLPGPTNHVLDTLAAACVQATFFLIGRNAAASPELVKRIASDGHTIGNHTQSHPWTLRNRSFQAGLADIDKGAESIRQALGGAGTLAPFIRFPGFVDTPELLEEMSRRNVAVFGADFWASDWNPMSAETELHLVLGRLEHARRGIILFHDTKQQTAAMLPGFLRALKERGFKVVHTVPRALYGMNG